MQKAAEPMPDEIEGKDEAQGLPAGPTKLTRTKEKWAREGKFLTGRRARPEEDRLPPGQHLVRDWPVLDLGLQPDIPKDRWRLDVGGLVERPAELDVASFSALPRSRLTSDIHCVTSWSRYDNAWEGLSTADLLAHVVPSGEARFVQLLSYDGYTTNMGLEDFAAEDALLADGWEGAPLSREHGGPVRLVVPHLYFWKSAKWLKGIVFAADDERGFWEVRGYHNHADPWREERYSDDEDQS
jgi:DMSO/TMAO reductase YedYZ molybdopterin-dependent catalytic subunit